MVILNQEVNISNKRYDMIFNMVNFVMDDLCLSDMTVNICSSKEMASSYNADGLCYGPKEIDIVNKRNKKDLYFVIAHELRHAYQYKNKLKIDTLTDETDAVKYEKISYDKFKKNQRL